MSVGKKWAVAVAITLSFLASFLLREKEVASRAQASDRQSMVTMAPSTGEIAFALGLGEQVVGVSRFSKYPAEVAEKAKVGGYVDVDLEAIVRLSPDVVVLLKEQADLAKQLESLGMHTLLVDHMSVEGILDSITRVGEYFGKVSEARRLRDALEQRVASVRDRSGKNAEKKALLLIGREVGVGKIRGAVVVGSGGYHQELLALAGYTNAYQGEEHFPQLTREHLLRLQPDVIIDVVNTQEAESAGMEQLKADWAELSELHAVQRGKVFQLIGDQHFIPGPRFVETLEWIVDCEGGGDE